MTLDPFSDFESIALPQSDFRGKQLTFEQFCDLTMIGMAGLTDYLLAPTVTPYAEGMVNYKLIADGLGLSYTPEWLDRLGRDLENGQEALVSHESLVQETLDDKDHWVYLNSGFNRIASLLYDKYYIPNPIHDLNYADFRDLLLFELGGMVQDGINEDGTSSDRQTPSSYGLATLAKYLELPYEPEWIARIEADFS